jgi:hypothetical protein
MTNEPNNVDRIVGALRTAVGDAATGLDKHAAEVATRLGLEIEDVTFPTIAYELRGIVDDQLERMAQRVGSNASLPAAVVCLSVTRRAA